MSRRSALVARCSATGPVQTSGTAGATVPPVIASAKYCS